MSYQDLEDKLIDYLDDALTPEQKLEVEQHLAKSPELRQTLEELRMITSGMEHATAYQPSSNLQHNFDAFLQAEKDKLTDNEANIVQFHQPAKFRNRLFLQIAAAAAILLLGIFVGKNWNATTGVNENDLAELKGELRTEMLALLQEKSTSGRIKAVNISYELEKPDDEIIDALIQTMNIDGSTNVRLSAIEALFDNFSNNPKVRTAFCETLNLQENQMIQLTLIKMLVQLKEKKAEKYLQDLIQKEDIAPEVRDEAQMGIFKMM
jgi:hypothetical protein